MIDEMSLVHDYKNRQPIQITGLIHELGIEYVELPMPGDQSGAILLHKGHFQILVNAKDGPQRRRFTAAHEVGHYLMHRDLLKEDGRELRHNDFLYGPSAAISPAYPFGRSHNDQANRFAVNLLMPVPQLQHRFAETGGDLARIAFSFGVSQAAMKIRLERLGLITAQKTVSAQA